MKIAKLQACSSFDGLVGDRKAKANPATDHMTMFRAEYTCHQIEAGTYAVTTIERKG